MQDLLTRLTTLKRPRILISAARHGTRDYLRERHLRRVLRTDRLPTTGAAVIKLLEIEEEMNDLRKIGSAQYSLAHHVEVLIAMMSEARLLKAHPAP